MTELNNPFPIIKSPHDSRDWIFNDKTLSFPSEVDYRDSLTDVRNQGTIGSCFAMSSCCMKEYQERIDYNFQDYFSPKFFYRQRQNEGEGMYGRDVMRILKDIGVCYESSCPYVDVNDEYDFSTHLEEAKQHVISHYARVDDLRSLIHAVAENGVCLITVPVYRKDGRMWKKNNKNEKRRGGHAMAVVGYSMQERHLIIRNSWGDSWEDKGYCYFPFEDWGLHYEFWTTVDDDSKIERLKDKKCCVVS